MPSVSQFVSASGNTELVPAPTSGQIVILGYQIVNDGMASAYVQLRSGSDTVLTRMSVREANHGGISCSPVERASEPYAKCAVGEALNVNLSTATGCSVNVQYEIR